jgi:acyl-CoA thioesterase
MSQALATVRNAGSKAGHTLIAVLGASRDGYAFTDIEMPVVPPPAECWSWRDPRPPPFDQDEEAPFWANIETRMGIGLPPWEDAIRDRTERAYWYRFDEPPYLDDGTIDPGALVVLCDTMPGAVFERLGWIDEPMFVPSADLTVHLFAPARSEWLIGHNFARWADDGYASVEMRMWDPAVGLVAYATQMMFFSFPDRV